ncbi:MAG: HD domain-containing protein [Phycisphaerae bacterium]|nr:HD domain-containing protein [Phycisphaerae bacterium]
MTQTVGLTELRRRGVERLMARYDPSPGHPRQVCFLAERLAACLSGELLLGKADRLILSCAALLHDIGWHVGSAKHHRRSYDLIKADGLSGFDPEQVELIAQVARYHRKAVPKLRHQAFARLNQMDRQTVEKLAGILRVADGLDRSQRSAVADLNVDLGPRRATIRLTPRLDDLDAELWAAGRKQGLLETLLKRSVVLQVVRDHEQPGMQSC